MEDIESIGIKVDGFGNSISRAEINSLIDKKIEGLFEGCLLDSLKRITELETKVQDLESLVADHAKKSASDLVLNETRSKLEIRANIVFEELKCSHKLNSATIIYICSLTDGDYKAAGSIMDKVVELFPDCTYIDFHKRPGQSKVSKWLNLSKKE